MAFIKNYDELDVFKEAFSLSLEIHKASLGFPKIEQYALADQLRRSSKSICANIAEGFAKQQSSKTEFRRFLLIALGSSEETSLWIKYTKELSYINEACATDWDSRSNKVSRMLQSLISKMAKNINNDESDTRQFG